MRPSYDRSTVSATPIYDSLCNEYRRLFRTLPGDRSGEEELRFRGFTLSYGFGPGGPREYERRRNDEASAAAYAAVAPPSDAPPGSDGRQAAVRGR
ncbi:hypothetical protein [Streptomyces sp. NBC_01803]|uniref:hypothetical protein n=1 Tax=Streptomyces sp. NBC_01803 TaxID=2975946 RepID=UPI002DD90F42|nr:hypothetical protein [Streptomyces sp. NBC_01803]WSA47752.1 hypothetical protein OIE51_23560 [Streptomyces sp. NBC_01803]